MFSFQKIINLRNKTTPIKNMNYHKNIVLLFSNFFNIIMR